MKRSPWPRSLLATLVVSTAAGAAEGSGPGVTLETIAQVSGRPPECRRGVGEGADRWARARLPGLGRYCDELLHATTLLAGSPEAALRAARDAGAALPGRAASVVLEARALLRLGSKDQAWATFERARRLDSRSLEATPSLADYARTALFTGHNDEAARAYRDLALRVPLLESGVARVSALVSAAALVSALGPQHLPEAVSYLNEARRQSSEPGLAEVVAAALALALERQARLVEAQSVAAEGSGPWLVALLSGEPDATRTGRVLLPDLPAGEIDAMVAVLASSRDPELARERWTAFLQHAPEAPEAYRELARARLRKGPPERGRKR